jgi:hypothetical protein
LTCQIEKGINLSVIAGISKTGRVNSGANPHGDGMDLERDAARRGYSPQSTPNGTVEFLLETVSCAVRRLPKEFCYIRVESDRSSHECIVTA